jgi:hypothetical protein
VSLRPTDTLHPGAVAAGLGIARRTIGDYLTQRRAGRNKATTGAKSIPDPDGYHTASGFRETPSVPERDTPAWYVRTIRAWARGADVDFDWEAAEAAR